MTLRSALKTLILKKYFAFSGRASRAEFWYGYLVFAICLAFAVTFVAWLGYSAFDAIEPPWILIVPSLIGIFLVLFLIIPILSVTVRRLHDRELSGWWILLPLLAQIVPYAGPAVGVGFLALMTGAGTVGINKYGADPRLGAADPSIFE